MNLDLYYEWTAVLCPEFCFGFCENRKGERCPIRTATVEENLTCKTYFDMYPEKAAKIVSEHSQRQMTKEFLR